MALELAVYEVADHHAMLEWFPHGEHDRYEVQIREEGSEAFHTLSDKLKGTVMRKKHLGDGKVYYFRVRGERDAKWGEWSEQCKVATLTAPPRAAPAVRLQWQGEGKYSALVSWAAENGDVMYTVQMRREGNSSWTTLSETLKGTSVLKKNLDKAAYVFRVRSGDGPWSLVSTPQTPEVHPSFRNLFGNSLLKGGETVPLEALVGKTVAVYFSASWCPPCRAKTEAMLEVYPSCCDLPFEIVFVSADHDVSQFAGYYGKMPWMAVPFNAPQRQQAMAAYGVKGIPHLMVFSPTAELIVSNAAGMPLTREIVDQWVRHK